MSDLGVSNGLGPILESEFSNDLSGVVLKNGVSVQPGSEFCYFQL